MSQIFLRLERSFHLWFIFSKVVCKTLSHPMYIYRHPIFWSEFSQSIQPFLIPLPFFTSSLTSILWNIIPESVVLRSFYPENTAAVTRGLPLRYHYPTEASGAVHLLFFGVFSCLPFLSDLNPDIQALNSVWTVRLTKILSS